ncbi:MAG: hypothetical protein NTX72_05910 [Candidatus Uhrbacteria bacterium]|nr:hypothetical protein [Candidatus Uhrbacteria bacterium]
MSEFHEGMSLVEQAKDWLAIAQELDELQRKENDGRGVSCVRNALTYLKMGDIESAQTVCSTDWDKIRNYPELAKALEEKLMGKKMDD